MRWIRKRDKVGVWYYPSEHIKSFIGLPGYSNEKGEHEVIDVCIDHTPDSWDGFQEWWDKNAYNVEFKNCIMPTQYIYINEASAWFENIKGPCKLYATEDITLAGNTIMDPSSELECGLFCYNNLRKPINKSLINFDLTNDDGIYLNLSNTTPFMNCEPIGNYSLTCEFKNPVDLKGVKNIGPLDILTLNGEILPNNAYELLMSDIKDLSWDVSQKLPEMNKFLTAIKEYIPNKRKTGWMAIWEFTNKYPQFSDFMPKQ